MRNISDFVLVHDDLFDGSDLVEELESWAEVPDFPLSWKYSETGRKTYSDYRSSLILNLGDVITSKDFQEHPVAVEFRKVHEPIDVKVWDYREHFSLELRFDEGWSVNKYGAGSEYKAHFDAHPDVPRVLSAVAFLNTPDEGGELDFPLLSRRVEAKNGRLVLFPSSLPFLHHALPVTAGAKYSLVSWLG